MKKLLIIPLLFLFSFNACPEMVVSFKPPTSTEFSFESFKELVFKECKYPVIVISQAILESGNFNSNVWKTKNNPFGIRMYKISEKKWVFREFDTWQESVLYYADFQERKYKGGDYFAFLDSIGYATDPLYTKKVKQIVLTWD